MLHKHTSKFDPKNCSLYLILFSKLNNEIEHKHMEFLSKERRFRDGKYFCGRSSVQPRKKRNMDLRIFENTSYYFDNFLFLNVY